MKSADGPIKAVLLDLLMGVMDSVSVWTEAAAGDEDRGLAWRDAATRRMRTAGRYVPYEGLVTDAAAEVGLGDGDVHELLRLWPTMARWPDAAHFARLRVPYAFVTNCSTALAVEAAGRSGLRPAFVLAAEEAGWYKPRPEIYLLACERIGARPDEALFVAGSPYDAEGARAAGLRVALVPRRPDVEAPEGVQLEGSLAEVVEAVEVGRV